MADDDPSVRRSIGNLLMASGWEVETFASAEELLRSGRLASMRALVLDMRLGGMSGLELLAQLRALGSVVAVVMLTAHGDVQLEREAFELGALAFMTKPFEPETLLQAVRAALAEDNGPSRDH